MSENNTQARRPGPPMGGGGPGRGGPPMFRGEKPKNFKGSMKKLVEYMAPFKLRIVIVLLCSVLATVLTLIIPRITKVVTDELVTGVQLQAAGVTGGVDFAKIGQILLILVGIYVVSLAFSYLQGFTMTEISTRVAYSLRNSVMEKINKMPINFFHETTHGEVLSRITNDIDSISMNLSQSVSQTISTITNIVGALILMLSLSWQLTLVALLMIPLSGGFTIAMVTVSQKFFKTQQKLLGTVNGCVEEVFSGHTVIKAFCAEERVMREFDVQNDELYKSSWKAQFLTGLMMPIMRFIGNLGYVAICMLGAYMTTQGTMTVGGIQAFIQYINNFTQPITQIANISSQLQSMAAAAERVFEFLAQPEEVDEDVQYTVGGSDLRGDVTFEHVKFAYSDAADPVIKDFSAEVKAGQKVAIVGPTGAGKTTMVKLLMRFHDLHGGKIYIDGLDTAKFARNDLRREFGMVLQDTWLYNGTIMENIRYGKLDATDEEVVAAAKAAQVDHFVRTLPEGYAMELNEETSNISQGQKQLLTIARAILADSKILILDEATSSVDTRTEILIQRAMDNLLEGRTSFVIAHRLSTIRNADLILVMRDGDIVESGNHDDLLERGGFYAELYNSQFETVSELI